MIELIRFSEFLRRYLEDEQFTQEDFAGVIDVARSSITIWLRGDNPLHSRKILCDYFGKELNNVIEFRIRDLLWKYIDETNKNQSDIAAYVGIRRQTVNKWCCGRACPTARNMHMVEKMLRESGIIA